MSDPLVAKNGQDDKMRYCLRAMQMWEIRGAVASLSDYADAITLLYVSKDFFHAAIRVVWGTRWIDTQNLLGLLNGFKFTNQSRLVTLQLKIPQPLPSGYFDRFHIYASHIRKLDYGLSQPVIDDYLDELQYHSEEIRGLTNAIGATVLLPNLVSLRLGRHFRTLRPLYDLRLLGLLVSPSLAQLTLIDNVFIDRSQYQSFLHFLGTKVLPSCPELQEISLLDENQFNVAVERNREDVGSTYSFKNLPIPKRLSALSFSSDILNTELLSWISKISDLSTLTVHNLLDSNAATFSRVSFHSEAFQNLRSMSLTGCEAGPLVALWKTPIVARLEEVNISLFALYEVYLETLFNLFATRSRQMKVLRVVLDVVRYSERGDLIFIPDRLNATPHANLVEFNIEGLEIEGPNPVSAIAKTWPSLRHLELSTHFIELDDFLQIPMLLPQLEYLRVTGPEALGDTSELERILELGSIPRSYTVSTLEFATYPLVTSPRPNVCDPIARFLARWWPRMQLVPPEGIEFSTDERELGWADACTYINQRIFELSAGLA